MSSPNELRVLLLGNLRLAWNGEPFKFSGLPKTPSLLAFLLLYRAHPLERAQVAFTLWADDTESNARANLRRHLQDLKRALPPEIHWVKTDAETIWWNPDAPYSLDVADFERLTSDPGEPTTPGEQQLARLSSAVKLYHGDLCENLYDDWLAPERERRRDQFIALLEALIGAHERADQPHRALEFTQQLVRYDPLREETYREWMRLLALRGDRAGLVRVYTMCATVLERELGVTPTRETVQLYEQLVHQAEPLPSPNGSDLPTHPRTNLPHLLTPLIGRELEVEQARARLTDGRLVTLTGAGGVGKTHLALQVAWTLVPELTEGAWYLDFAGQSEGEPLMSFVAQTLELAETTNQPLEKTLLRALGANQCLLLFDNCEHVVHAAATLAHRVLSECPRVRILATSREALNIPREQVLVVPPLTIPAPEGTNSRETLMLLPSAQLLVARAQESLPTFHVTDENAPALASICRLLEGIPLALELAAARLNVLSAAELETRLQTQLEFLTSSNRVAPARQQTLRATFDWSFALLTFSEQILLTRLAVFGAHFTLDAAEAVCSSAALKPAEILRLLSMLIDKSLVHVDAAVAGTTRYRLLEVTRQFALEELGTDHAAMRRALLAYYVGFVQTTAAQLHGARQADAYAALDADYGNIRSALEAAWTLQETRASARLCGDLWTFWWTRGYLTEGRMWLERALTYTEQLPPEELAELLNGAGRLAILQGDVSSARPLLEEHLRVRRGLDDVNRIGDALNSLGVLYYHDGEAEKARAVWQESLELFRASAHVGFTARALNNLGDMAVTRGDVAGGLGLLEESYSLFRELDSPRGESIVLINLGTAALQADAARQVDAVERARTAFRDSIRIKRELADQDGIAWALEGMAVVNGRLGDFATALMLWGAAERQRARLGTPTPPVFLPMFDQIRQQALEVFSEQEIQMLTERGDVLSLDEAIGLALR